MNNVKPCNLLFGIILMLNYFPLIINYRRKMTDNELYKEIRRLVKEQKVRNTLDKEGQDFAQEYCRIEMLKKKQLKPKDPSKINHLVKNFKNVESYINIMDIIKNLPFSIQAEDDKENSKARSQFPEIIPKLLQSKIKQKLGPILNQKYQEESKKRQEQIQSLQSKLKFGNSMTYDQTGMFREMEKVADGDSNHDRMQIIDSLRQDIKRKEVYFIEKKFDDEMREISKLPKKIENTKIFHKICSYLHMILEQQHREKWASREDKKFREMRRQNSRHFTRKQNSNRNSVTKPNHSIFRSSHSKIIPRGVSGPASETSSPFSATQINLRMTKMNEDEDDLPEPLGDMKKLQSKKQFLKQNFTFRRRNVKANVMSKINQFVENMTNEQKKNGQVSKKYGKALQSLSEEIKSSYSQFEREDMAEDGDISEMKKYLDNTLSRNKKNLKKFHRKG